MIEKYLEPGAIVPINEQTTKMLIDALKQQTYRNLVEVTIEDFNKMSQANLTGRPVFFAVWPRNQGIEL